LVTVAVPVADVTAVVTRSLKSSVVSEGAVAAAEVWIVVGAVVVVKSVEGVEAVLGVDAEFDAETVEASCLQQVSIGLWTLYE